LAARAFSAALMVRPSSGESSRVDTLILPSPMLKKEKNKAITIGYIILSYFFYIFQGKIYFLNDSGILYRNLLRCFFLNFSLNRGIN